MGVGRRMKKQSPPPDLAKVKTGGSNSKTLGDQNLRGKKRRASGEIKPQQTAAKPANGNLNQPEVQNGKSQKLNGSASRINAASLQARELEGESSDDDVADLMGGGIKGLEDDVDSPLRNSEDIGLDGFDAGHDLNDDFLGSDPSVYDSDPDNGNARFSDDDDSDAMETLTAANIEGLSRKLDQQKEAEQTEAQLEEAALQTNIDGDKPQVFDANDDQVLGPSKIAPDLQLLRSRMTDTIRVLDNFSDLAEQGRSRTDYISQLLKDICLYYGYSSYLAEKLFNLFSPREAFEFFEANETARPVVIRTNTLRTHRRQLAQALINRGVTLEPVGKWSKVGLQVFESSVPLGATPEYLAGHYILQAASSFLPVMALAPQENERILDMAAAPGGKTTYMAALMKNTGCIFANDSNKARAKGLIGNVHRLGVKNTIICNYDAKEFPRVIGGFDRVLLDAPCSGTGVISKDPTVKTNKTELDFMQLPHLQKQLLLSAIDSVDHTSKSGGYIVYSTCSVTVEENEQVVQYALSRRPNVKLVETGLIFGRDGFVSYMGKTFDAALKKTKRYYPHAYNVDGFYVSKFKKTGPSPASSTASKISNGDSEHATASSSTEDFAMLVAEDAAEDDDFGGFDEAEDQEYMERARRRRLRKKGIDPRSVGGRKAANGQRAEKASDKQSKM